MARFDVCRNLDPDTRDEVPYLLVLQSELLEPLATRVVAPLFTVAAFGKPMSRLTPRFSISGDEVVMSTAELAGVPLSVLGPVVANLADEHYVINAALDLLLTGF